MAKKVVRRLAKGDIVRDLSEVIRYFNSTRAAKNLKFKALLLARTPEEEACMKQVTFKLNEGSYTDMKGKIVVSLHDNMIGYTLGKVLVIVLGELYHEVGHVLFTDNDEWQNFVKEFGERFEAKGINRKVAELFGNQIMNSIEDGREECCITKEYGVTKTPIATMRSWWWTSNDISTKKEVDELSDNLFCFASLSSMGWLPKGYAELYQEDYPDLYNMWINLKPLINKYVVTENHTDAMPYLWEIVDILEDWLLNLMSKYPNPEDLEKLLSGVPSPTGSGTSGMPSKGMGGKSKPSGGSSKTASSSDSETEDKDEGEKESSGDSPEENPVHDFFNNSDEDDGGLIDRINSKGTVDADESMDSIVSRAMKEAEDFMEDEDFDNIVQADFDDKKNKLDDDSDTSDLNDADVKDIEHFYDSLDSSKRDGNWGIKLKYHHYTDAIQPTPEKIRIAARPLYNAFKKMLNNKNADMIQDRKSGQLNLHRLYRIVNNDTRLFQKKSVPNDTDFVFYLLIDGSGSMGHDKFVEAYRAAALLEEGLKGLVPLKIAQFDCDTYVHHRIVKDFKENSRTGNYSWTYYNHHNSESCNMDGYNIRVAIKELEQRTERNKVLIILSDGQPSGYSSYYGDLAEKDVKDAVRGGRRQGIKIFNIMFGSAHDRAYLKDDFKYMYERGIVSTAPENIGTELLKIVRHELF